MIVPGQERKPFKVVLIANTEFGRTYGLNILFSVARRRGVDVQLLYLKEINVPRTMLQGNVNTPNSAGCLQYDQQVLDQVAKICDDSQLVGLSLLTSNFSSSVQLTQHLRTTTNSTIIWGGKHPSINPEECLEHADIVAIGEAEDAFSELLDSMLAGKMRTDIHGLSYRIGPRDNPLREPVKDISRFPRPDYFIEGKYVLDGGRIRPVAREDCARFLSKYPTMIARGCPMRCSFCTNSAHDKPMLRLREADDVISEIRDAKASIPGIRSVFFRDDTIMCLPKRFMEEFFGKYKSEIGLPFTCSGVIPTAVTQDKTRLLTDAGLVGIKMGVQSGSPRIRNTTYARPETDETVFKAARILASAGAGQVYYMFITDCHWENDGDRIASIRFVSRLPRPFRLSVYSLDLYPGTRLYYDALAQGIISNGHEHYNKSTMTVKNTYANQLLMLQMYRNVAVWRIYLLSSFAFYYNKPFKWLFGALFGAAFGTTSVHGIDRKPVRRRTIVEKMAGLLFEILFVGDWRAIAASVTGTLRKGLNLRSESGRAHKAVSR